MWNYEQANGVEHDQGGERCDCVEQGTLLIMCAGVKDLYEESLACFDAAGKKTYQLGELG